MGQETKSDSTIGDIQQTLRRVNLPYVDGLYDMQEALTIQKNKDRENISTRTVKGISLRGFSSRGWLYANSNRTDPTTLRKLANKLNFASGTTTGKLTLPEPIKLDKQYPVKKDPQQIMLEDKLQKIRDLFGLARNMDSRIVDVHMIYMERIMERALSTSHGTWARQRIPRTRIMLQVIVKENGVTEYDIATAGGAMGYEVVD